MNKTCTLVLALIALLLLATAGLCFARTMHDGKDTIGKGMLRQCIAAGISATGYYPAYERVDLLLETAAAETLLGKYDVKHKLPGSYGIFQVTKSTAEDTVNNWFKRTNKPQWEILMTSCYDPTMSMVENLTVNVEFSAAVAFLVYKRMAPFARINTRKQRAALWKRVYNTSAGIGTEQTFLKRCRQCLGDEEE